MDHGRRESTASRARSILTQKLWRGSKARGNTNHEPNPTAPRANYRMKKLNLLGQTFGRWTALVRKENSKSGHTQWLCRCSCGTLKIVHGNSLVRGLSRSCGCYMREVTGRMGANTRLHGFADTPEYQTWLNMHRRCYDTTNRRWKRYGKRGIQVCVRWHRGNSDGLANFINDMGQRPSKIHSIDRINNDSHYMPSNCRWATRSEQMRNRKAFKLDPEKVRQIRLLVECGRSRASTAKMFNVSESMIDLIIWRKRWSYVT